MSPLYTLAEVESADDILDLLPLVADRGWSIRDGYIRDRDGRCPICALVNELSGGGIGWKEMAGIALRALASDAEAPLIYASQLHPVAYAAMSEVMDAADLRARTSARDKMLAYLGL